MNRLTKDDVKEMNMIELSHNQVFVKNHEAWYRDYDMEMTARDLARAMFARNDIEYPSENDDFDEYMLELLQDGFNTLEGLIALYYNALWSMAEIRERLKDYEDTGLKPGEVSPFSKELVKSFLEIINDFEDLDRMDRLIILPCKVGDTIWLADFDRELSVNAKQSVQPLKVCFFRVTDPEHITIVCETRGESWYYVYPLKLGKTVFLTREEAERALGVMNYEN